MQTADADKFMDSCIFYAGTLTFERKDDGEPKELYGNVDDLFSGTFCRKDDDLVPHRPSVADENLYILKEMVGSMESVGLLQGKRFCLV